jgi:hypothetical protein
MFKRVLIALGVTLLGLMLGAMTLGMETAFEWLFGLFGVDTNTFNPQPDAASESDPWWLLAMVLFFVLVGAIYFLWPHRRHHERTKKTLAGSFAPNRFIGRVYASEDGKFGYLPIKAPKDLWNENHKFFQEHTYRMTRPTDDDDSVDESYFIFVERAQNGIFSSLPASNDDCTADILLIFRYRGIRRISAATLSNLHALFSETSIPLLTTAVTGICVFFLSLIRSGQEKRWLDFCTASLEPFLTKKSLELPGPPAGIYLSEIEISVVRQKGTHPIKFLEVIENGAGKVERAIFETLNLYPFGKLKHVMLKSPGSLDE